VADNKVSVEFEVIGNAAKKINEISDSLGDLGSLLKVGGAIGAGVVALGKAFETVFDAEQIRAVNNQFSVLAKNAGIAGEALKNGLAGAAGGLIDDTDLIKLANKSIVEMGGNAQKLPQVFELAKKATAAFGGDLASNFETISGAIASGQTKALKNLGIVVDSEKAYREFARSVGLTSAQLDVTQKQQALLNAVLEKGQTALKGVDITALDGKNTYTQLKVTLGQVGETAILAFDRLAGPLVVASLKAATKAADGFGVQLKAAIGEGADGAAARIIVLNDVIDRATKRKEAFSVFAPGADDQIRKAREEIDRLQESQRKLSTAQREGAETSRQQAAADKAVEAQKQRLFDLQQKQIDQGSGLITSEHLKTLTVQEETALQVQAIDAAEKNKLASVSLTAEERLTIEQNSEAARQELRQASYAKEIEDLQAQNVQIAQLNEQDAQERIARNNRVIESNTAALEAGSKRQLAAKASQAAAERALEEKRFHQTEDALEGISTIAKHFGKEGFEVAKQFSAARAVVAGILAVQNAYADVPYPFNFAAAGIMAGVTAVQVADIESAQPPSFKTGVSEIPPGFANDRFPMYAQSGEAVLNRGDNERLARLAERDGASTSLLAAILNRLDNLDGGGVVVHVGDEVITRSVRRGIESGRLVFS
jgi:hypothetical protein